MTLRDSLIAALVPIFLGFGFVIAKPAMEHLPPFLLMVLSAEAESLSVIHLFSSGIKKRFLIKLTLNLLLVLFRDLETLFPKQLSLM